MERRVYGFPCEEAGVGFNGFCVCVEQLVVGDNDLFNIGKGQTFLFSIVRSQTFFEDGVRHQTNKSGVHGAECLASGVKLAVVGVHDGSGFDPMPHSSECVHGFVDYGVSQGFQLRFGSGKVFSVSVYVVDDDVM